MRIGERLWTGAPLHWLPFEAAAGLFELGFSPRHVSQQGVQLLQTEQQQSEHKYE